MESWLQALQRYCFYFAEFFNEDGGPVNDASLFGESKYIQYVGRQKKEAAYM